MYDEWKTTEPDDATAPSDEAIRARYGDSVCPECGGASDWHPYPACGTCKEGEQGVETDGMP